MDNIGSSDLLAKLKQGNPKAFEVIYNELHQKIYNFSLRLLLSSEDAKEIVQRVFVALWEQRDKIDKDKSISAYLFSIARYMIYQEFRNQVYRKAALEFLLASDINLHETTKDEILFNELTDILHEIIDQLPARQKEIFHLSRDSGLSYKQIADQLNISENTVDTQLRRALNFVRIEYKKRYSG
jgi:RNA polymerase sigma-70 factor (ECF subfamily)